MRRSLILDVSARYVFPTVLVFALFLLFSGHNAPGGGFAGGLVAGAAFVLRDVANDFDPAKRSLRAKPELLLGLGLLTATLTGVAGLVAGGELLESGKLEVDVPVLGTLKATSALPFDIGVFLVVVGVVTTILDRLGEEPAS